MKWLAALLRKTAQWLDPQPMTIVMCMVDKPIANPNRLMGVPTMYWKNGDNGVTFYPVPERDFTFQVRL